MKTVLICGGGIAGPALAYWLARHSFQPTLLEQAPAPRTGGQAVDVRGVALDVLNAMGLLEPARELRTRIKGVSLLDEAGRETFRATKSSFAARLPKQHDIEILRDDLASILLDKVRNGVELIYGESVACLHEDSDGIDVTFERRSPRRFDLVIGADGLHSGVRSLLFGDERQYLIPLGYLLATFSAPNHLGLEDWQVAFRKGGEGCHLYTARNNTELRVGFGLVADPHAERPIDRSGQQQLLTERLNHLEWEIPTLLAAMRTAPDFYFTAVAQVRMKHQTKGRVALVGDAGYGPSQFSTQSSSLAVIGAYVLAHELARFRHSHVTAFEGYEARMREYIEMNQLLARLTTSGPIFGKQPNESAVSKALAVARNGIVLNGIS